MLRITDAEAPNWLPRALRTALTHWRYRRRNPPPPQPQPPRKRRRSDGCTPPSQARGARGWRRTSAAGHPPNQAGFPNPGRTPHPPHRKGAAGPRSLLTANQ